jgi:hypothetical protein
MRISALRRRWALRWALPPATLTDLRRLLAAVRNSFFLIAGLLDFAPALGQQADCNPASSAGNAV